MSKFECALFMISLLSWCTCAQKPPKEFALEKCTKRITNQSLLDKCRDCIVSYKLSDIPSKDEIRGMIRKCIPKKEPKDWMKIKCEEGSEKQEEISACFQCVEDYSLPRNITRDDVRQMKQTCVPKPSYKLRAKRRCIKRLTIQSDIDKCQACIQSYDLPEHPSCDEVKEMKRRCMPERGGRELWAEPLLEEDEEKD